MSNIEYHLLVASFLLSYNTFLDCLSQVSKKLCMTGLSQSTCELTYHEVSTVLKARIATIINSSRY
jgi:hypothetical protein